LRQVPFPQIYGMLLDRAIDFQLLANAAEAEDLSGDPDVQAALAKARSDVLRDAYVRQAIDEGTTEERLQARYDDLKSEEGFTQEEVHARHILVASEDEAKKVIAELQVGADFAALAQEHSIGPTGPNGGDLCFYRREQMVPEFAEAAFAQEPSEHTQAPVQTQFGWHVIEVVDRRTGAPSFEETEPRLRQEVAREIVADLVAELRDDAEIERSCAWTRATCPLHRSATRTGSRWGSRRSRSATPRASSGRSPPAWSPRSTARSAVAGARVSMS
jgi:peptidyl-prolyl cis-trans isomerase C